MNKTIAALVLACLGWSVSSYAQDPSLNDRIKALSSLAKVDAEYRLGPGDLIEIAVFGVDSLHQTIRISASGFIKLPLLEPVEAAGLTPTVLEQRLTSSLEEGDVVKDPQVSVFVKEYRSQPVYILGAVKTPGQYQMTMQLKIVDVIAMAGGLQSNAVDEAVIQRKSVEGVEEIIKVNLNELLEKSDQSLNVVVRGGDVIHIQERLPQSVYVIGDVNHAGQFTLPPKQDLRVSQVFAWAGGPLRTARMRAGILVRYSEKGERQQLSVNFDDILRGKKDDFLVRANDVIFIPGSKFKTLGYGVLSALPGSVTNIPYWLIP